MNNKQEQNSQAALWNGSAGRAWVDSQELLDEILEPFQRLLVEPISFGSATRVLDVGCGTGSTTFAVAARLGRAGSCTGIDISEPMLTHARARTRKDVDPPTFVLADAQTYAFPAGSFDLIVSRFGVMFFEDPVAAFANLRRAARAGGELRFLSWRDASENPFMTTAERVAAPLLPSLPARRLDEPGQFAFADPNRVRNILEEGKWSQVDIQRVDVPCAMPEKSLMHYVTRMGPVGRVLQEANASVHAEFLEKVRAAFEPYVHGEEVRFVGACWLIRARA